ncbi:MAG: hypothetical protein A2330_06990 [Ignavibacteria bacterium RIFOXYB2_FULL_36_7]|nr:MAG: hypothetical protein A2330_06990 [Ignavibacteria bacterium RIFOXYB2_FULL_36_7]
MVKKYYYSKETKNGKVLKVKEMGMNKSNSKDRGNLFVKISIQISQNLTDEEIKLFEKLKSLRS